MSKCKNYEPKSILLTRTLKTTLFFLIEEDEGSDSGTEPQDDDFIETRFSRTDPDCTPSQKSEEERCNMRTTAENWEPVNENPMCRTLHYYLPVDTDVFKKHTSGNKYRDCAMVQRQSSSTFGHGQIQTLDFPLSHRFPQHRKAPAPFGSEQVLVMPPSSSSKHMGQFSFFPQTISHEGVMFSAQSVGLPSSFMCQLPKHILASQVSISSHFILPCAGLGSI